MSILVSKVLRLEAPRSKLTLIAETASSSPAQWYLKFGGLEDTETQLNLSEIGKNKLAIRLWCLIDDGPECVHETR